MGSGTSNIQKKGSNSMATCVDEKKNLERQRDETQISHRSMDSTNKETNEVHVPVHVPSLKTPLRRELPTIPKMDDQDGAELQNTKDKEKITKPKNKPLKQRIKKLEEENDQLKSEIKDLRSQFLEDEREIQRLRSEAEELRLRLSKVASDRLTDNNPNIADLSDEKRANKVGEMFSELYSNEWSDAFEELTLDGKRTESEAIKILLDILLYIYEECTRQAEKSLNDVEEAVLKCTGCKTSNKQISSVLKVCKVERKNNLKATTPSLITIIEVFIPEEERTDTIRKYVDSATEICWLMCILDPPLSIRLCNVNHPFKNQYFSPYTKTGKFVEYLIWPALLLHHDGPLLQKGVAQGRKTKRKRSSVATQHTVTTENADSYAANSSSGMTSVGSVEKDDTSEKTAERIIETNVEKDKSEAEISSKQRVTTDNADSFADGNSSLMTSARSVEKERVVNAEIISGSKVEIEPEMWCQQQQQSLANDTVTPDNRSSFALENNCSQNSSCGKESEDSVNTTAVETTETKFGRNKPKPNKRQKIRNSTSEQNLTEEDNVTSSQFAHIDVPKESVKTSVESNATKVKENKPVPSKRSGQQKIRSGSD